MKLKNLLQLLSLLTISVFAQETEVPGWIENKVYIDPTYQGTQDGSISKPFKSTTSDSFEWTSKNAYLFKRNTILNFTTSNQINQDSILIGAYDSGIMPILNYSGTGKAFNISETGVFVNDIELWVPAVVGPHGIAISGDYVTIYNCTIKGGHSGIRGEGSKHLKILNCDVSGSVYDGIYVIPSDTVTIKNTYVHDMYLLPDLVNQGSIDCIHMENLTMVYIDSVSSDHSNFPGKFALIINGADSVSIKKSTFIGYKNSSCVYDGCPNGWFIENSYFEGGEHAIWCFNNVWVYNCVFKGQSAASIYSSNEVHLFNCTFIDVGYAISNWQKKIKEVKNCIFYNLQNTIQADWSAVEGFTNNCFFSNVSNTDNWYKGTNYNISDPLFVSVSDGNFILLESSPCINSGIIIAGNNFDKSGMPRNNEGAPDYGAYEFTTGLPSIFNLSSDGIGCAEDTAILKLNGSEPGVSYKLFRNEIATNQILDGTGSELNFGEQFKIGFYSVLATNKSNGKTNKMKDIQQVMVNPLPTKYYLLGGGFYDSEIGGAKISLSSSDTNIYYQLYLEGVLFNEPISGTGNSIDFGIFANIGIYTAIATDPTTNCAISMPNFVIIAGALSLSELEPDSFNISPNPTSGDFTICIGNSDIEILDVSIFTMSGSRVYQTNGISTQSIPVKLNVPTGEYVVTVSNAHTSASQKLLIIH